MYHGSRGLGNYHDQTKRTNVPFETPSGHRRRCVQLCMKNGTECTSLGQIGERSETVPPVGIFTQDELPQIVRPVYTSVLAFVPFGKQC